MDIYPMGSVHGRFQPLHKGHLEYILAAKQLCTHLFVGITQFNNKALLPSPVDRHREDLFNNPMTYFERTLLIKEALMDEGVSLSEFTVIPFPIDTPSELHGFLITDATIFTTIYDEWNRHKVAVLRDQGYKVVILWERDEKKIDGVEIRNDILNGDPKWKMSVPPATIRSVEELGLRKRLKGIASKEN